MRDAISRLYVHVLLFFQQAIKWYNQKRIKRVLSAVFSPFELKYKDTVDQIQECAKAINVLATSKSHAELRYMHTSIELFREELRQQRLAMDDTLKIVTCTSKSPLSLNEPVLIVVGNKTISERIDISVQDMMPRARDIQLSHVLSALKPQSCPHETLHTLQSIVKRSRAQRLPTLESKPVLHTISQWLTKDCSSLFVLRVGPRAEAKAREITTDMVTMLKSRGLNVIWRLSPPKSSATPCFKDILKALIHQAIALDPALLHTQDFDIAKFQSTHTDVEWTSLFKHIFSRLQKCYIIVEAHDLFRANQSNAEWMNSFVMLFQELASDAVSKGHTLKILLLCYGTDGGEDSGLGDFGDIKASLKRPVVTPVRSRKIVAHRKGVRGWERVVPKL
jgi:hypothetical protein